MEEIAITFLRPKDFASSPQTGTRIVQDWHSLARWLTWPTVASDKRAAGAWCPCDLDGGRVKGGTGPVSLLVADVDECGSDGIDRSASALAPYLGAVVPTFSATKEHQKHRIVTVPDRPILAEEWPIAWPKFAATLAECGIIVDAGCKNINRLYFACVARSPEAWMGARFLNGKPINVDAMLAAAREELAEARAEHARRARLRPVADRNRDRYTAAAIDRARANVASAGEGGRHDVLLREAYSLARLNLSEHQIESALLDAFVSVAGEARRIEGQRAIRDAVAARGRGAA